VLELIKAFEYANGLKLNYKFADRRPGDIATCYASTEKAERELHWKAEKTITEACADNWRWQSGNPKGFE
jgi:UDP-glucose 4-epimerase